MIPRPDETTPRIDLDEAGEILAKALESGAWYCLVAVDAGALTCLCEIEKRYYADPPARAWREWWLEYPGLLGQGVLLVLALRVRVTPERLARHFREWIGAVSAAQIRTHEVLVFATEADAVSALECFVRRRGADK